MKCKECGTELSEIKKTLIVDNVEYETETHDFNKTLSEINIPEGWRLWTVEECTKLFNSHEKELKLIDCWFFIEQPFEKFKDKYVGGFRADSVWANFLCNWDADIHYDALGVRFCRGLSKFKKVKVKEKK